MNYIAHCDGEREQSILEHLQGTAEKAKDFAEVFEKGDWGYCCGMLHDIGKYSDKFQRRIRGEEIKVDHATAGARVCMELGGMYPFLEMCIAGHHAGLSDYGVSTDTGNSSTTLGRRKKKIEDFYAYKKEVKIPELKTSPVNVEKTKDLNFSLSMFTRMMYSCLVDADFLDTEEFMTEERSGRQQGQEIQVLLDKLEKYITEWLKNTETESVNGRRTEILKACLENGEREKGLFRLTVPTGGGKTVASLAFGAVMTTFVKASLNCGQVRGPVQLGFARSIDPVISQEVTITRVAITTEKDAENKSTEMGRKSIVPYALYRAEGFISANLARKTTGFTEEDLELLWDAIINMFENDHSAARGKMSVRELIVFKHSKELGDCPAYKLFDAVEVTRKENVEYPRRYQDYTVEIHNDKIPESVEVKRMI